MTENKHWLSLIKLGEWYSNAQYYYRPRNDKERNLMHNCYEEGYNKGYEDGKPKWHDLRKNPEDLPEPNTAVLICFRFEKWTTTYIAYYRPAIKKWQIYNLLEAQREPIVDDYIDSEEVIAWCEIPKFEEK